MSLAPLSCLDDFYPAVDALIRNLRVAGCDAGATRLHELLHETAFTTSSELLGELALALRGVGAVDSAALREEVARCIAFCRNHRRLLGLS